MKNVDVKNKSEREKISKEFKDYKNVAEFKTTAKLIESTVDKYKNINVKLLVKSFDFLEIINSSEEELKNSKEEKLFEVLNKIDSDLIEDDTICPVCDSNVKSIRAIIMNKINKLNKSKSEFINFLNEKGVNATKTIVDEYIGIYNELKNNENLLYDYVLCAGNLKLYEECSRKIDEYKDLNNKLKMLKDEARTYYEYILNEKDHITADFKRYFKIEKEIKFDDANYSLVITLPRKVETYSTGEIHLMLFLYMIYSFIGSDKETLILDDPVSSLDIINHYKIAYEIVRNSKTKNMIILTHNVDFINIINSQSPNSFEFYYLEEYNKQIYISKIEPKKKDHTPNIISLYHISDNAFIKELIKRENSIYDNKCFDNNGFHYTKEIVYIDEEKTISNYDLINLIDSFNESKSNDFYTDALTKIKYLSALRIWIEKQLYSFLTNDIDKDNFLKERTLNAKINFFFKKINSNVTFKKEDIMSKKVMLNQSIHYNSLVMPMAYAINLSFDQISEEIKELKLLFNI